MSIKSRFKVVLRLIRNANRYKRAHGIGALLALMRQKLSSNIVNLLRKTNLKSFPFFINKSFISYPIYSGPIKISILMPVYNTDSEILKEAIDSVFAQNYQNFELCICDDSSDRQETIDTLKIYQGSDPRIKITKSTKNLHIAGATNLATEFATGDFIAFLDHDDTLEPDALSNVVMKITEYPDVDLLYSDEDKIDMNGKFIETYFKPSWSPDHLFSVMYLLHFLVIRKTLLLSLGGVREKFSGAQDYDLALRASQLARCIIHIPKVLYHWRAIPGSAAAEVDAKPEALSNAKAALLECVTLINPKTKVTDGLLQGTFRVNWPIPENTLVTLLILTDAKFSEITNRGNILLVKNFLESILNKSTYLNIKILVVDNQNLPDETCAYIQSIGGRIIHHFYDGKFNFSTKINFALNYVETEHLIILNDDLEVISSDWIEALLSFSCREEIGAVGGLLVYPNGNIQHAGIILTETNICEHVFHNLEHSQIGYYGYTHIIRNYSAVTGAVLATRLSLIKELGGFNEEFGTDYNDIDYCLRLKKLGYRCVYTPFAKLYHFEGTTLKRNSPDRKERDYFISLWGSLIKNDPYFIKSL